MLLLQTVPRTRAGLLGRTDGTSQALLTLGGLNLQDSQVGGFLVCPVHSLGQAADVVVQS